MIYTIIMIYLYTPWITYEKYKNMVVSQFA